MGKGVPHSFVGISGHGEDANGRNPFTLTYGHEPMSSVEVGIPTYRVQHFKQDSKNERLDLLEEFRLEAEVRMAVKKEG